MPHEPIAIIGAGLMGHGIAQVFAVHGHRVHVYDPSADALLSLKERIAKNLRVLGQSEAALNHVVPCSDLGDAVGAAGFVIEAATENLAAKQAIFAAIEGLAPKTAVLASNTSVIPITKIMSALKDRARGVGAHWWNPPYLVPLVEVIGTVWTSPETIEATLQLHRSLGKTAIHVKRDVPGFIGNRLQHALWREAISLVERDICDAADVDTVIKASFGRRLAVLGPIENADLIGTDLTLAIHQTILSDIDARGAPSPYLEALVTDGRLGMKSGEGFLRWSRSDIEALQQRLVRHLQEASRRDGASADDTPLNGSAL